MGRPYDTDINHHLVNSLFQRGNPVEYAELLKGIKASQIKLSSSTLKSRLDYFKSVGILGKCKDGYYLTAKAYFLNRLKILYIGEPNKIFPDQKKLDQIRYFSTYQEDQNSEQKIKIYMKLSYFGSGWFSSYEFSPTFTGHALGFRRLSNEAEFKEFLIKYHLNEGHLKIMRDFQKGHNSKHITEFRADHGIMIRISKESNSRSYEYALPGFSLSEIEKDTDEAEFRYLPIKSSDVQEALDLLVENRVMEQIGMFEGEMRYRLRNPINSNRAYCVISKCWELQKVLFGILYEVRKIRKREKEVRKWFEFFYGRKGDLSLEQYLQELRRNGPKRKRSKQVIEMELGKNWSHDQHLLREEFEELIGPEYYLRYKNNETYGFFVEMMLEFIYPHFMRKSFQV